MPASEFEMFQNRERSNWVRLQTLVLLRWFAITGQITAVLVATRAYDLQVEVAAAALTIAASVLANLFASFLNPESKRLSGREATAFLGFDILQLSVLLFLTGGLSNPFAILLLAPVTIAATVLHLASTLLLGALAITLITVLFQVSIPILDPSGMPLVLPPLFLFGFWIALVIGVIFLGLYARQVSNETQSMGDALLATQLALAREQKLTDLGGVVAAAAHELGTPLATIKLVSSELIEDIDDHPDLRDDLLLIRQQADRCRVILQSMGHAGKDDRQLHSAPLEAVVREAAEPHLDRGKEVEIMVFPEDGAERAQPSILRRPEIIHGLRNLIQNAVDFSETTVEIDALWSTDTITVRIADDGFGFPQSVIGRIGDPFVRRRRGSLDTARRPGYEGMGLGLFIAKTLLERSGAQLTFVNGRRPGRSGWAGQPTGGAIVTVEWPREGIEVGAGHDAVPLGENQPITS